MKTFVLIALMTLIGARKEAAKRWPSDPFVLSVDQTKPTYIYELRVLVLEERFSLMGTVCARTWKTFKGKDWQAVFDASKTTKSSCVASPGF